MATMQPSKGGGGLAQSFMQNTATQAQPLPQVSQPQQQPLPQAQASEPPPVMGSMAPQSQQPADANLLRTHAEHIRGIPAFQPVQPAQQPQPQQPAWQPSQAQLLARAINDQYR